MGKILVSFGFMATDLVRSALSLALIVKGDAYPFNFFQAGCRPHPNCLDGYLIPAIVSLPNIHESKGLIVQRFITELYVGENV